MIRPFRSRILIQPDAPEATTEAGIILPDAREDATTQTGRVVRVGDGRIMPNGARVPCELEEGQRVLYFRAPAQAVTPLERAKRGDPVLIDEGDVLAVLEENPHGHA